MSTPNYDPIADPTLFDYDKSAISAPGVRPRWIYVPASVYVPDRMTDLIKGMTIFYGGTATEERQSTMLAVLHPTDPENASRIGWVFNSNTVNVTGPDAPQIIMRARGQRCWWLVVDDNSILRGLIDLASARDGQYEERALQVSRVRAEHASDIEVIGNALQEEAESRDWCSEYDEFVEGVNMRLSMELPVREREYEVEIDVTYRMTVSVTARSEDEALEAAEEEEVVDHDSAHAWTMRNIEATEATAKD